MALKLAFFLLALFSAAGARAEEPAGYTVAEGKLEGSVYKIAAPAAWNNKLLLIAHGGRPVSAPLSADFKIEGTYIEDLLNQGWLVAETSYRRNGIFVTDGLADLKSLYDFIAKERGRPAKTYIAGSSMGGKIALKLAEEEPGRFDGVLAIGAALMCDDDGTSSPKNKKAFKRHTFKPRVPVLFFSNSDEADLVNEYAAKARRKKASPAVWTAARRGHCNVNDNEIKKALAALELWAERGQRPLDETVSLDLKRLGSTARHADGGVYARLSAVDPAYGNLTADLTSGDLARAGIRQDSYFLLGFGGKKVRVFLGYHYADVKKGEWVAFQTAEDYLRLALNWANAQKELGCKEGDEIYLEPEPAPAK